MRGITFLTTLLILQPICTLQLLPAAAASQASQETKAAETVRITLTDKINLRSRPDAKADILAALGKGATVEVVDYSSKTLFYSVKHEDRMEYVSAAEIPENPALRKIVKRAFDRSKREEAKKQTETRKTGTVEKESAENAAKLQFFTIRFGAKIAEAIMKGDIWEGMNKEMVILAKGKPIAITRRVFSNIIKEQWEYEGGLYLFFENDLLKSHGGPPWKVEPHD